MHIVGVRLTLVVLAAGVKRAAGRTERHVDRHAWPDRVGPGDHERRQQLAQPLRLEANALGELADAARLLDVEHEQRIEHPGELLGGRRVVGQRRLQSRRRKERPHEAARRTAAAWSRTWVTTSDGETTRTAPAKRSTRSTSASMF